MRIHDDTATGLTSIWIEIPPFCHLQCSYCYTGAGRETRTAPEGMLSPADYRRIIDEFAAMGGREIGIPGRGEPFHPRNEALVRELIEAAYARGVTTMLFTTGETLLYTKEGKKETPYVRRENDDLIRFLFSRKVLLFVKYNSRRPEVQDRLVDLEGYTERRNEALDLLIRKYKFNEARKLGVATSYMDANESEIPEIYGFAKANNLVFDCDTVLAQGRGAQYVKTGAITAERYMQVSREIRARENVTGHPGGTYMTSACDRIKRHIYIDYRGDGYPCLGAWRKIPLGNIRNVSLREMWETPVRQKLRSDRTAVFKGVCARCDNFIEEECNSCLSRAVEDVRIDAGSGTLELQTRGCIYHRPNLERWTGAVREYLAAALQKREAGEGLRGGLETLWSRTAEYGREELRFPLNTVWEFVSPDKAREAGDILANAAIPSARLMFNGRPEAGGMRLVFRFRDLRKGTELSRVFADRATVPAHCWTTQHPGSGSRLEIWTDTELTEKERITAEKLFAAVAEPLYGNI